MVVAWMHVVKRKRNTKGGIRRPPEGRSKIEYRRQ